MSHDGPLSFTIWLFCNPQESPSSLNNCHLSASIFVRCTKNTGHLGNHVGSLLSTESAGSTLSRISSKSPNSSSLAELKLQPKMVEGAKKMESERTCKLNGTISSSLDQGSFSITHRFWSGIDENLLEGGFPNR